MRLCVASVVLVVVLTALQVERSADASAPDDGRHDATSELSVRPESQPSDEPDGSRLVRVRVSQFQMGMMVHLTAWAPSREHGRQAAAAAFERIEELNLILSDYEPESELSRLCRRAGEGPIGVSAELFEVVAAARRLAALTDGLYDPTIGPVVRLWRQARQTGQPPDRAAISAALELVGYEKIQLDEKNRTIGLTTRRMQLDLGGVGKGYVGDQAVRVLREHGLARVAFEAGGDKVFGDPPPGQSSWPVDVDLRLNRRRLANCAIGVSGPTQQYLMLDGKRYSHVIDPRTGLGITTDRLCVAVAPRGVSADPLATLGTLMPGKAYHELLKQHYPDVHAVVVPAPVDQESVEPRVPPPDTKAN